MGLNKQAVPMEGTIPRCTHGHYCSLDRLSARLSEAMAM